jgi:predicted outer membrane protein
MSIAPTLQQALKAACVSCLLVAGYAQAQQAQQPAAPGQYGNQNIRRTPSDPQQADRPLQGGQSRTTHFRGPNAAGSTATNAAGEDTSRNLDHYIANCLVIKNEAEIKANEFGEARAENPKVKEFARQMINDHRQLVEKLQQLTSMDQAGAAQASTRQPAGAVAAQPRAALASNQQYAQLLELDRKITDQCGQLMQQKLGEKQGAEFDKCFMAAQVGNHIHMLAALEVISQDTTGQLQQLTNEAKAKVQQHLQHAEQIAKELESSRGSQQAKL